MWTDIQLASLASRSIHPCTSYTESDGNSDPTKHRITLWYSTEDSFSFPVMVPSSLPLGLEFRPAQAPSTPMEMGSNDIKGELEEDTGNEGHGWGGAWPGCTVWQLLMSFIVRYRSCLWAYYQCWKILLMKRKCCMTVKTSLNAY